MCCSKFAVAPHRGGVSCGVHQQQQQQREQQQQLLLRADYLARRGPRKGRTGRLCWLLRTWERKKLVRLPEGQAVLLHEKAGTC